MRAMLNKLLRLIDISGRLIPKIPPGFIIFPALKEFRNGCSLDHGIFKMIFKEVMKRGKVGSMDRGIWNCTGITESMGICLMH